MALSRRLVVNADDFGQSPSINAAVIQAHREGILTTASLMVNEPACEEAVALARQNPRLGVGLHLTFLFGHSALSRARIPGLVNDAREFGRNPAAAGFRFFFFRSLRAQLRDEMLAQLEKFKATGLQLDHLNGHLHLHMHPTLLRLLDAEAPRLNIKRARLTHDPFALNMRLASGRFWYRAVHAFIFHFMWRNARPVFEKHGWRHTRFVFGLLQNAFVDESYILRLVDELPEGDSELYSHPSLDTFRNEFEALISPRVAERVRQAGIRLIRYQDL